MWFLGADCTKEGDVYKWVNMERAWNSRNGQKDSDLLMVTSIVKTWQNNFLWYLKVFVSPEAYLNIFILKYNICIFEGYFSILHFSVGFIEQRWWMGKWWNCLCFSMALVMYPFKTRDWKFWFFPFPLFYHPMFYSYQSFSALPLMAAKEEIPLNEVVISGKEQIYRLQMQKSEK